MCFSGEDISQQTDAYNEPCSTGYCQLECFGKFDYPNQDSHECWERCPACFEEPAGDKDADGDPCNRVCEPTCETYKECIVAGYCPTNCIPEGSRAGNGRRNLLFASMPVCPPCCVDKAM